MIDAADFVHAAQARGCRFWSGVPCSYLTPLLNHVLSAPGLEYVAASNEGDAVAMAVGAHIGGRRGVVMIQNAGLGNAVNPLTSLAHTHRVPFLFIVSRRGDPEGEPDEPQHALMGAITTDLLDVMRIRWERFPESREDVGPCLDRALAHMDDAGLPYCLVMRKGAVAAAAAAIAPPAPHKPTDGATRTSGTARHTKNEFLRALLAHAGPHDILVSTTGYTSRELYALRDAPNHLYVVGAMGCASSVAAGLALARPDVRVTVLDGDGAALMRLGALAAIGHRRPPNLLHVVFDNRMHESTGGQYTVSANMDLARLALACAYPHAHHLDKPEDLVGLFTAPRSGLTFARVAVVPGVPDRLPRPTISPPDATRRLTDYLRALERAQ